MRILAEETMALIIDFQDRLVPVIHDREELLHNAEILIKGLHTLNIPVIATQQYTKGLGMTVSNIAEAIGEEFIYYDKLTFSCADDEKIMKKIEETGKKNILICGIETHICVLQTVLDLIYLGYHVILVENCIGSRKQKDHNIGLQRAIKEGAMVTTYESILFELTRVAGTEVFKAISKLIK